MSDEALLLVTDQRWEGDAVTVIDADEFEAASNDPEWRAFCEQADTYVETQRATR